MSRIKSHYTVAEQELNLYTFGKEFMTTDRKEYRGLYHKYLLTNEIYTNSTYTNDSKKLIPFFEELPEITEYKLNRDEQGAPIPLHTTTTTDNAPPSLHTPLHKHARVK